MQQAKYPNLDNVQEQQQSNQHQELSYQLSEFQDQITPNINAQSINNQQWQQYQQYSQYQTNQVIPQIDQHQVQLLIPQKSNLIKDLEFSKQKYFISGILGLFIFWTFIFYLIMYLLIQYLKSRIGFQFNFLYPILLIISAASMILLSRFVIKRQIQSNFKCLLIYFGLIFSYLMFYLFLFCSLMWNGFNKIEIMIPIAVCSIIAFFANIAFNFIALIYVLIEQTKLRIYFPIIIEIIVIIYFSFYLKEIILLISLPFCLIYPICLMIALKQILQGRFNLENNQVIKGTIITFYCLFVCCKNQE